jgi:dihydrodipicolinate synthase/N-acetylneuraminate lyase
MTTMGNRVRRREFLRCAGGLALVQPLVGWGKLTAALARAAAERRVFRGVFAILQTPFTLSDEMDTEDLAREADFCVRAGGHGLVWPQLGAEFYLLSEDERMRGAEVILGATSGRRPVVIGVQAPFKDVAIKLARHAEGKGADALISLPPYLGHASLDTVRDYYQSLARAVKLPIFVQNSGSPWGPALSTEFVIELARGSPQLGYIKEEVDPAPHRLEEYARSGVMAGIFSGDAGRNMLNEIPRGSSGTMPACEFVDVEAEVYNLAVGGKNEEAEDVFQKLLPMINLENTYGMEFAKFVLVRRGVFKTAKMRNRTSPGLDKFDERELDAWWKRLQPYLKV